MKRELLCVACGEQSIAENGMSALTYVGYPREFVCHVRGTMRLETLPAPITINDVALPWTGPCVCDSCNTPIPKGDKAVTRTSWVQGRGPYVPWESQYLEP